MKRPGIRDQLTSRAEEALAQSEERFRQIAESIREVFWLTDAGKHAVIYVSPAYEAVWGRSCRSLMESPCAWLDAIHAEDRQRVANAAFTKQSAGTYDEEYRVVRPDGTIRWIRDRAFPITDAAGEVVRIAGVAEDMTERRQLEAQLRQAQKMESVGQLAGGVAHDFNNVLTVIMGSAELLAELITTDDAASGLITEILAAAERAASLTRQLLAFSRKQVIEPQILEMNGLVADTEKMLKRLVGEDIQFESHLDPRVGMVKIDPGQWVQVLMNLAVNARDAMPAGGTVTIATSVVEVDDVSAQLKAIESAGQYVVLQLSDSGCGMPPEVQAKIFEPFFTTKGIGRGTGLGLAVVYGIVKQAGGQIDVTSEPNRGTTFTIYLPSFGEAIRASAAKPACDAKLEGDETILIVEDEPSLRRIAVRGLRNQGYTIIEAGSGLEALRVCADRDGAIDLVVTDIVMPGMDGRTMADVLRGRAPGVKVLFTSGYTERAGVADEDGESAGDSFLQKPYTPISLSRKVRALLDQRA